MLWTTKINFGKIYSCKISKKSIHKQVFGQVFGKKYASVWLISAFNTDKLFWDSFSQDVRNSRILLFLYIGILSDEPNNLKIAKQ